MPEAAPIVPSGRRQIAKSTIRRRPAIPRASPMTPGAPSFAVLLSRARRGDAVAVSELCRQYEPRLRVVARVLLGPALRPVLDSMDLVQSVHRSLIVGMREEKFNISTPENLIALALTLLRRKVARQWRRMQRQRRLGSGG